MAGLQTCSGLGHPLAALQECTGLDRAMAGIQKCSRADPQRAAVRRCWWPRARWPLHGPTVSRCSAGLSPGGRCWLRRKLGGAKHGEPDFGEDCGENHDGKKGQPYWGSAAFVVVVAVVVPPYPLPGGRRGGLDWGTRFPPAGGKGQGRFFGQGVLVVVPILFFVVALSVL